MWTISHRWGAFQRRESLPRSWEYLFTQSARRDQQLEEEGLVEARAGSGFIVKDAAPLSKSERMERGASILGAALKEAVGIGPG